MVTESYTLYSCLIEWSHFFYCERTQIVSHSIFVFKYTYIIGSVYVKSGFSVIGYHDLIFEILLLIPASNYYF